MGSLRWILYKLHRARVWSTGGHECAGGHARVVGHEGAGGHARDTRRPDRKTSGHCRRVGNKATAAVRDRASVCVIAGADRRVEPGTAGTSRPMNCNRR